MLKKTHIAFETVLSVILTSIFPVLFLYTQNVDEVNFSSVFGSMITCLMVGGVLFFIALIVVKSPSKSAVISNLFIIVVLNFALIELLFKKLFSNIFYWHILPIVVVALLHASYFLTKRMTDSTALDINKIVIIVFGALLAFNFLMAMPTIVKKANLSHETDLLGTQTDNSNLPNIYYVLLDEYSGFEMIKKYYNYDNFEFCNNLKAMGFSVSLDSYNESIDTITITTNSLNLAYIVSDDMIQIEKQEYRNSPSLFKLVSKNGYSINNLASSVIWEGKSGTIENLSPQKYSGFSKMLLQQSIMYPLIGKEDEMATRANTLSTIQQLKGTFEDEPKPVFTYAHLDVPHAPFVFDKNGNMPNFAGLNDWKNKSYYLEQYIYVTKLVEDLVQTIVNNDPDSIVILQSDHGARWTQNEKGEAIVSNLDARNILNAVYFRGQKTDEINGESAVNTLIIVMNKLLDTNLSLVEVPKE